MADFDLNAWPRLSDASRIKARHLAEKNLKNSHPRPDRQHYQHHTIREFSDRFVSIASRLVMGALIAAFIPSAVRLFITGATVFNDTLKLPGVVPGEVATALSLIAGLCMVVLAETGQVIFSLAFATYKEHRWPLAVGLLLSTVIALVGNYQAALMEVPKGTEITPLHVLEALTPPILVMTLAYVQKGQVLDDARLRHANEAAYQTDLQAWESEFKSPDRHAEWSGFYARALRDTYARTYHKRLISAPLTDEQWAALVSRELRADAWYEMVDASGRVPKRASTDTPAGTRRHVKMTQVNVSGVEKVTRHLSQHPDQLERNRDELAAQLGVSRSTVNRGIKVFSGNGHRKETVA